MALFATLSELEQEAQPILGSLTSPLLLKPQELQSSFIDRLISTALFSEDETLRQKSSDLIYSLSILCECSSQSIFPLYSAFGKGEIDGFTVPAFNIRTLTYDTARLIFRVMKEKEIGAVIFEIARSEIEYTHQRPQEYAVAILAAAIKEGYKGPVFLQGDHYQFSKSKFIANQAEEIERLKSLIKESLDAKFYNIDIDASTLVDLTKQHISDQQLLNSQMTALLTSYIREIEPQGQTISIGGEIGHIGDKNSTVEDFTTFMELYLKEIQVGQGISKVSIQTGTSHGGTINPDGSIQEATVDFSVLKQISSIAREKYHLGGAVQHGASTLPLAAFDHFAENKTLEIHLATGLQNVVFDTLPSDLKEEMVGWLHEELNDERKEGQTDEQFVYKTRKKALGPFKQVLWELSPEEKGPIMQALSSHLEDIFEKLRLFNTREKVLPYFA